MLPSVAWNYIGINGISSFEYEEVRGRSSIRGHLAYQRSFAHGITNPDSQYSSTAVDIHKAV